jgi:hypothetical protein
VEGFVKIRRGLCDHLRDGKMNLLELGVYLHLQFCADFRTGIHKNSAGHIYYATGQRSSVRQIQRALEALEKAGYIKRFIVDGRRGDYYILIHKFFITYGAWKDHYLNAQETADYSSPVYELSVDDDLEEDVDHGEDDDADRGDHKGDDDGEYVKKSGKNFGKNSEKNSGKKSQKKSVEGESLPTPPDPDILEYLNGEFI